MARIVRIGQINTGVLDTESLVEHIDKIVRPDAPSYINGGVSNFTNELVLSAQLDDDSPFVQMCREAEIYDLMFGTDGLLENHPGCVRLTPNHVTAITLARIKWRLDHHHFAGYEGDDLNMPVDSVLARLIWLEWWVYYSLTNCSDPGISIS